MNNAAYEKYQLSNMTVKQQKMKEMKIIRKNVRSKKTNPHNILRIESVAGSCILLVHYAQNPKKKVN